MKLLLLHIMIVTPSLVPTHREPGYEDKSKPYKVVCFYTYPENKLHVISIPLCSYTGHIELLLTSYKLSNQNFHVYLKILISYVITLG